MCVLLTTLFFLTAATQAAAAKVPALIFAVQSGRASLYKPIIRKGKALDVTDSKGRTAAHYAIIYNDPKALELLFKHGANPNVTDDKGKTLLDMWRKHTDKKARKDVFALLQDAGAYTDLFQAARAADLAAVNSLLAAGENAKAKNADGKNPFVIAAEAENHVLAAILLEATVGINGRDERGWSPLLWAIVADDWKLVRAFIRAGAKLTSGSSWQQQTAYDIAKMMGTERKLLTTYVDENGSSGFADLLVKVVEKGEVADLKLLLEYGANPSERNIWKKLPLIEAARIESLEKVDLLLRYKANINDAKPVGDTALLAAVRSIKTPEITEHLLKNKADPNNITTYGVSPLMAAARVHVNTEENIKVNLEIVELLLKYKAKINYVNDHGDAALIAATRVKNKQAVVKLMLAHDADHSFVNNYGSSALTYAASTGDVGSLEILLIHGADPNFQDNSGETPLAKAVRSSDKPEDRVEKVRLLLAHGADPNISNEKGETPVFFLIKRTSEGLLRTQVEHNEAQAKILELLLGSDADPTALNQKGESALSLAEKKHDETTMKPLLAQLKKHFESKHQPEPQPE